MKSISNRLFLVILFCTAAWAAQAQRPAQRFEVSSIKAVRPMLEKTIAALQKKDVAGAKAAFEEYDNGWNGIEMYVNRRSREMYDDLEKNHQDKISKSLNEPNPNAAALVADVQAMLAKYDEMIRMVESAPPISPLYDNIARLRIVRADLRPVNPALKAGDVAKARQSFNSFSRNLTNVEQLLKSRSSESYDAIKKGTDDIVSALNQDKPNAEQVSKIVNEVTLKYNLVIAEITKEAQSAK